MQERQVIERNDARMIGEREKMELDLENDIESKQKHQKISKIDEKLDKLCDKISTWCNRFDERMNYCLETAKKMEKVDARINKMDDKIKDYEEREEKGKELLEQKAYIN